MATITTTGTAPAFDAQEWAADLILAGLRPLPTQAQHGERCKRYRPGYGPREARRPSPFDFEDNKYGPAGIALATGAQPDGTYLVGIDPDVDDLEILGELLPGVELLRFLSTSGRSINAVFKSETPIEPGELYHPHTGERYGELKADGGAIRFHPDNVIGGHDAVVFSLYGEEETRGILAAIGYRPRRQVDTAPAPVEAPRHTTYNGTGGIEAYNRQTDFAGWLLSIGARRARGRGLLFHCPCPMHQHGDKEASLSLMPARNAAHGAYVLKAHSPACIFAQGRTSVVNAFQAWCLHSGVSDPGEALRQLNPRPDWKPERREGEGRDAPPAPRNAPVPLAADQDFNQTVPPHQNAVNPDFNADALRLALWSDSRFARCPVYRQVALYMLENGGARFTGTKAQIATALGTYEKHVQRAWGRLTALGYGERSGGGAAGYGGRVVNTPATWAWSSVPPHQNAERTAGDDTHTAESAGGDSSSVIEDAFNQSVPPHCNAENDELSPIYIYNHDHTYDLRREEERDTSPIFGEVSTPGASYNPAHDRTAQSAGAVVYASTGLATEEAKLRECARLRDAEDAALYAAARAVAVQAPPAVQLAALPDLAPRVSWVVPDEYRGEYARLTNFANAAERKGRRKQAAHFRRQADALRVREAAPAVLFSSLSAPEHLALFATAAD